MIARVAPVWSILGGLMDDRLKDLLQRLLGGNVEIVGLGHDGDCGVEAEIGALKARFLEIPASTESDERVIEYVLDRIARAGRELSTDSRKRELELELRMLNKPDDVDLDAEEHAHTRLHIEADQLRIEAMKRDGAALVRFLDVVRAALGPRRKAR